MTSDIEKILIKILTKMDSGGSSSEFDFHQLEVIISQLVTDKLLSINNNIDSNNVSLGKIFEKINTFTEIKPTFDYYIDEVTSVSYQSHYSNVYSIRWELISGSVELPYYAPTGTGYITLTGTFKSPAILQEFPLLPNMKKYNDVIYSMLFNNISGKVLIRTVYSY